MYPSEEASAPVSPASHPLSPILTASHPSHRLSPVSPTLTISHPDLTTSHPALTTSHPALTTSHAAHTDLTTPHTDLTASQHSPTSHLYPPSPLFLSPFAPRIPLSSSICTHHPPCHPSTNQTSEIQCCQLHSTPSQFNPPRHHQHRLGLKTLHLSPHTGSMSIQESFFTLFRHQSLFKDQHIMH